MLQKLELFPSSDEGRTGMLSVASIRPSGNWVQRLIKLIYEHEDHMDYKYE
jgi:hypothetical protein